MTVKTQNIVSPVVTWNWLPLYHWKLHEMMPRVNPMKPWSVHQRSSEGCRIHGLRTTALKPKFLKLITPRFSNPKTPKPKFCLSNLLLSTTFSVRSSDSGSYPFSLSGFFRILLMNSTFSFSSLWLLIVDEWVMEWNFKFRV